jgi:hypothetical protein
LPSGLPGLALEGARPVPQLHGLLLWQGMKGYVVGRAVAPNRRERVGFEAAGQGGEAGHAGHDIGEREHNAGAFGHGSSVGGCSSSPRGEAALLMAVQRVIGGVEIERDLGRRKN